MNKQIELRSDNAAGVAPEIIAALADANIGSALAYCSDEWTDRPPDPVRPVFEHHDADVCHARTGPLLNPPAHTPTSPPSPPRR